MLAPVKINYKIYQGSTFKEVLRWESPVTIYKTVSGITKAAPSIISTTEAHGIPKGWRFKITDVAGMKEINSATTYRTAIEASTNQITTDINSFSYTTYTSGGVLEFKEPVNLTGFSAKMQIRPTLASTDVIVELTSVNGGIILDPVLSTITINISADQTASFSFSTAVYSLELTKAGEVFQLTTGTISLVKEVTR